MQRKYLEFTKFCLLFSVSFLHTCRSGITIRPLLSCLAKKLFFHVWHPLSPQIPAICLPIITQPGVFVLMGVSSHNPSFHETHRVVFLHSKLVCLVFTKMTPRKCTTVHQASTRVIQLNLINRPAYLSQLCLCLQPCATRRAARRVFCPAR